MTRYNYQQYGYEILSSIGKISVIQLQLQRNSARVAALFQFSYCCMVYEAVFNDVQLLNRGIRLLHRKNVVLFANESISSLRVNSFVQPTKAKFIERSAHYKICFCMRFVTRCSCSFSSDQVYVPRWHKLRLYGRHTRICSDHNKLRLRCPCLGGGRCYTKVRNSTEGYFQCEFPKICQPITMPSNLVELSWYSRIGVRNVCGKLGEYLRKFLFEVIYPIHIEQSIPEGNGMHVLEL